MSKPTSSSPLPSHSTNPTPSLRLARELREKRPDAVRAFVAELNRRIEAQTNEQMAEKPKEKAA